MHGFLQNLALVLCVAAITTVLFRRLRQPVVLGYILAGLIIGPHVPIPLVADHETIETLSELGVILLMFALGLEFSLRKLVRVAPTAGVIAVIQVSLMLWLGYVIARAFGWTTREAVFTGAILSISSTTIIAKAFDEQRITGRLRELVFAVLIVEDLIAILLLTTLTTIASGAGLSSFELIRTVGRLGGFLVGLIVVGVLVVPRAMRAVVKLQQPETTVVSAVGLCFAVALLAKWFGYSVALGAFLAGSLVAESGVVKTVEHLVAPVRDIFAAVFFVAVGMMIDPALIARHWVEIVVLTVVVVVGKLIGVAVGAFFAGSSTRESVRAGMSMAQIGEFSFIIAGLGLSLKATGQFLYPIAVAVSAVTTLLTPWLIRASDSVAKFVDRTLPKPLQTFATLYGTWLERMRGSSKAHASLRRPIRVLLIDAAIVALLVIGTALERERIEATLAELFKLPRPLSRTLVFTAEAAFAAPFCVGIALAAQRIGQRLALRALPSTAEGQADLAAAPRRTLVVALQLVVVIAVGAPLVVITEPFLPPFRGVLVLAAALILLGIAFWRSATNLQGHVRAGAEMIAEALATQSRDEELAAVDHTLPGLGHPVAHRIADGSPADGCTIGELNIRGLTGATVLAIRRGDTDVPFPSAKERLQSGDLLALAGTHDAIAAARALLDGSEERR